MTHIDDLFDDTSDLDYSTPAQMPPGEAEALERASYHMMMAGKRKRELDQLKAVYKATLEDLKLRLAHRTRILEDQIRYHHEPVESLHMAIYGADPERATIELPWGTSKVTTPRKPKVEITDEAAVLAWAEVNRPELLGHTINVTAVKTVAKLPEESLPVGVSGTVWDTDTGETIPGVRAVLEAPKWSPSYDTGDDR